MNEELILLHNRVAILEQQQKDLKARLEFAIKVIDTNFDKIKQYDGFRR